MPRPKRIDRPVEKKFNLPETLCAQVDLHLFSAVEGRIPYGKWSALIQELLEKWLAEQKVLEALAAKEPTNG